jgi:hypothetical protein
MLEVWSGGKDAVSVRWVRWTASPSQCVLIWGAERVGGVSECEGYVEEEKWWWWFEVAVES